MHARYAAADSRAFTTACVVAFSVDLQGLETAWRSPPDSQSIGCGLSPFTVICIDGWPGWRVALQFAVLMPVAGVLWLKYIMVHTKISAVV